LYSHDALGIGHLRRNLLIAGSLAGPGGGASVLMLAGVPEATAFQIPPRVDVLTLPALRKMAGGGYEPRRLGISAESLLGLRANALRAAMESFEPDVLIVDKLPLGVAGELRPTLESLAGRGRTRCVLGLRDVLDDPARVRLEWAHRAYESAVERFYDAVWVYGDARVYDPVREYGFGGAMVEKVRYTGYLERVGARSPAVSGEIDEAAALGLPADARLALCMVGGGEDGGALAEAFSRAVLPEGMMAVVLTGPFMPAEVKLRLSALTAANPRLRVVDFIAEPASLLRRAGCVVTMGGYNCVCEALCAGKPALVVPRVKPRVEQWIRARRFGEMGLLDVLHPDEASPAAISRWLHGFGSGAAAGPRVEVDFGGLERLPGLMAELLRHDVGRRSDVSAAPHGAGAVEKAGHAQPRHATKESAAHAAR
jgi:predicted glycosyltransferase